uniref:Uncharacterized protein n=1 Tax=Arundo donax TaxID=35708 RepID=A0A0A8Z4G8_ARUDO
MGTVHLKLLQFHRSVCSSLSV